MFQSLRTNNPVYIFHKGDKPFLEIGYVTSVSAPKPKYPVPSTVGQPQDMIVNVTVKVGDNIINYNNLPAQLDVADSSSNGESIVISDNKEAMNAEILSLKKRSTDILNSIDYHKDFIEVCDSILAELNPEFAEKQAQKSEIKDLKQQVSDISKSLFELMESNRRLIERLGGNYENVGN